MDKQTQRYTRLNRGVVNNEKELHDLEWNEAKAVRDSHNLKKFVVPKNMVEADWTGTKYVTSHRCFGKRCRDAKGKLIDEGAFEDEKALVQTGESQVAGHFEEERDKLADYPETNWTVAEYPHEVDKSVKDFVHQYIASDSGRLRTQFEVDQDYA